MFIQVRITIVCEAKHIKRTNCFFLYNLLQHAALIPGLENIFSIEESRAFLDQNIGSIASARPKQYALSNSLDLKNLNEEYPTILPQTRHHFLPRSSNFEVNCHSIFCLIDFFRCILSHE